MTQPERQCHAALQPDVIDEDDALAPYREATAAIEAGAFSLAHGRLCPPCPVFLICGA
jgi:hypothetical protein